MPALLSGKKEHLLEIMATFSLGGGVTPGAPGVYINERAGVVANADIANFSTVYMLVETPETVPVTVFPYNTPTPVTSLNDYFALVGGSVPESRIPLLSYNCVNEFFQNAQVGDLRVVRVGTPDQIVEIEILPNGTKQSNAGLPSNFEAGDVVYAQLVINGNRLVAGDGSTGYNADGEWLGVPVTIPVDYIAGDEVNNRRISSAIATAIAEAIESNPSVRSAVYVRDFGLVTTINPLSNSENAFVSIAASTFDANVSVVPLVLPVGAQYVMMQNVYNIQNIVGQQQNLERVPQDYIQCINTAFDGQQDQGYLITPTAYAQFDADGRSAIGAAAAEHCANNNYKWMALADPGPFLVTDVNKYSVYTPHQPAANLVTGLKYLVDNAMYEWTGADVTYDKLTYQALIASPTAETAVTQSKTATPVAAGEKVGLLDSASFEVDLIDNDTRVFLGLQNNWPVSYQIQEVTFSGATGDILSTIGEDGTIFVVAPPHDLTATGDYSFNIVFFALDASSAVAVLNEVIAAGGSINLTTPANAVNFGGSVGTCNLTYVAPFYNLPQTINGQTSNLLQNITGAAQYVNTLHLPASIQEATANYRLNFVSRTILDPDASVAGSTGPYTGAAQITCVGHGLTNGQKLYFTQPVKTNLGANLFRATTKISEVLYYVKVVDADTFSLAESLTAYTSGAFVTIPSGTSSLVSSPTIFYTKVLGGEATSATLAELSVVPFIRGRKYGLNSGQIASEASVADAAPAPATSNPAVSVFFNNSLTALGVGLVSPFGEDPTAGWLPELILTDPGSPSTVLENWYCTPTVDQNFASQAFLVPAIDPILGGEYDPSAATTTGPLATLGSSTGGAGGSVGTYNSVTATGGTGTGAALNVVKVASTTGPIAALGTRVPGSGSIVSATPTYTNTYTAVALNGGTGSAATGNVTVTQTAGVGPIAALGAPVAGAGTVNVAANTYTNTYTGVALVGGSGSAATANVTVTETAAVGPLVVGTPSVGAITGGTGGTPGTYSGVTLNAVTGVGAGATANIVVGVGGDVTGVTIVALGADYEFGDSLDALSGDIGGVTGFSFLVDEVTLPVAVSAVALNAAGTGYAPSVALTIAAGTIGGVTGAGVALSTVTLPIAVSTVVLNGAGTGYTAGNSLTISAGDIGGVTGSSVPVATITAAVTVSTVTIASPGAGVGYTAGDTLTVSGSLIGGGSNLTVPVATITPSIDGAVSAVTDYASAAGIANGSDGAFVQAKIAELTGVYFEVTANGTAPDATTPVVVGDRIAVTYNGSAYDWVVVPAAGDLSAVGQPCYGSQVGLNFTPEVTPPSVLWRFDPITSTEIINDALRGVGFNGVPQAEFIEAGVDNVNRLYTDSQRYFQPFGFIAYYGPYIENASGQWIPPSPYVTGIALRRYRAEGYQFPPAGVKYQLADAVAAQIPINSAQQNLLNPEGCNAIRTLPGYPTSAVFVWGGRTRVNSADAQQRLYQFVNTRVILNVVYGSLRNAFDSQIFNVIDGFGVAFNQIISVGNSVLNQLYSRGALFGARPSDAFQVICDSRINPPASLENGIINAKVFVTPVPTLERIQIDLIRVAIGQMQNELNAQGLGTNNTGF